MSDLPQPALASDQLSKALLENVREFAIIQTTTSGAISQWNAGAQQIFGHPVQKVLGRSIDIIYTPEDRDAGVPQQERDTAAAQGCAPDERWHLRADGVRRFLSGHLQPVRPDGQLTGFLKIARDETQRHRAVEDLRHMRKNAEDARRIAEEANAAKDRFLAVLSHELRNPLAPILSSAQVLLNDARLPDDLRAEASMIHRNTRLEARLLDDLLDITRIVRGKVHLDTRPVSMDTLISQVLDICRAEFKAKGLEVTVAYAARRSCVLGDAARLQQILWNLVKNAIKFSPPGATVALAAENPTARELQIRVQDQGIGIAPDRLEHIFEPFEQGDDTIQKRYGGLGLGLSISRALAELHQGVVSAHSDGPGRGASFDLRLPVIGEESCVPDLALPIFRDPPKRTLRILLVEDNLDTARGLSRLLSTLGHSVTTATDLPTALELAEANVFDVLLSDIGLGEHSGLDLIRALRINDPTLRAIALTGYGTPDDVARSREAGFDRHLTKPVDLQVLEDALRDIAQELPATK